MASADEVKETTGESDRQRGGGGGNLYLTCLRIRFEERGSWSKALEPQVDFSVVPAEREGEGSPDGAASPGKLPQEKSSQHLAVPQRCDDESSSSNSSPTPRKFRSKLAPLAFGYSSEDVLLQQSDLTASGFWGRALGGNDVAAKKPSMDGADRGLAMTAKPLRPLRSQPMPNARSARGLTPARASYYYELEVLQTELATNRTLALGFCWSKGLRSQDPWPQDLPGSFLLGGELPRAVFGSTEVCRPVGWRPLVHVLSGSRVGALLEVRDHAAGSQLPVLRLSIIQDGSLRAEAAIYWSSLDTLTEESRSAVMAAVAGRRPFGLVEVGGSVSSVRLCTDVNEPSMQR